MTNQPLLNDLKAATNHNQAVLNNFLDFLAVLARYHQTDLLNYATAEGITTFDNAKAWFTDYFIIGQNEGSTKAHQIQQEITKAETDPTRYNTLWPTNPDFNFGYDWTPEHFFAITDNDLTATMTNIIEKVRAGTTNLAELSI